MDDLFGGVVPDAPLSRGKINKAAIGRDDPMQPGPYAVGLTHTPQGDSQPYTICCGDGRAIAGHVESRACAEAIVAALNMLGEKGDERGQLPDV